MMSGAMYGVDFIQFNHKSSAIRPILYENRTFTRKMYLHPFSTNEVNKGYCDCQNPGY